MREGAVLYFFFALTNELDQPKIVKENHSVMICARFIAKVVNCKDTFSYHPVVKGDMILHLLSSEYFVENIGLFCSE